MVCRTFSKIYGLAGLRIGYALAAPEVADLMNRVRQPFNVNNLAIAGALAALDDHEFVATSYALNAAGKLQLVAGFERLGLSYIPSFGNFVTFKVGDGAGEQKRLFDELQIKAQQFGVAGLSAEEKQTYIRLLTQRGNQG